MSKDDNNTLFLRLAGPMQSWGTSSRFQLRRTDAYPSKSGVLGMLLCAKGISREESPQHLKPLTELFMGVRVDRAGSLAWDYQTAGAKIGIRRADGKDGGLKRTPSTREYETLLSRRQYLYDASFLITLLGSPDTVNACADWVKNPKWPVFLGRKCCVPSEPVFAGLGHFETVIEALSSIPWYPRIDAIDNPQSHASVILDTFIEHPKGNSVPTGARLAYDVPRALGFYYSYDPRWIVSNQVTAPVGKATQNLSTKLYLRRPDYTSQQWDDARRNRLKLDQGLCVFCKAPARDVHHVDYSKPETNEWLRSLCKTCHDACTMLEYGGDMRRRRLDPSDPAQRQMIRRQIERNLKERRYGQRRKLLRTARKEL
ncbi:MAG: type I-E CRISPR-associated protein Cas5/CasD [Candidatus Glassbacteria bacterium]